MNEETTNNQEGTISSENTESVERTDEKIVENTYTDPNTGKFKEGNPGKPKGAVCKNPIKSFSLKEFNSWTDEEKRAFLKKIAPIDIWKMTEGNPSSDDKMEATVKIIIASEDETDESTNDNPEG